MKRLISFILTIFLFIFLISSIFTSKGNDEYLQKIELYKNTYLNYEFRGRVIDIIDVDISKQSWLVIKTEKNIKNVESCCDVSFVKKINDSILKVEINGMLLFDNYHIPLNKNGYVSKKKGSSAIFYQYNRKIYLLSDIYCQNISIVLYYSMEEYQYPCDNNLKKVTNGKNWFITKLNNYKEKSQNNTQK